LNLLSRPRFDSLCNAVFGTPEFDRRAGPTSNESIEGLMGVRVAKACRCVAKASAAWGGGTAPGGSARLIRICWWTSATLRPGFGRIGKRMLGLRAECARFLIEQSRRACQRAPKLDVLGKTPFPPRSRAPPAHPMRDAERYSGFSGRQLLVHPPNQTAEGNDHQHGGRQQQGRLVKPTQARHDEEQNATDRTNPP
jgi:hypothetical protein